MMPDLPTPSEHPAVQLAHQVIDKYGADTDKPSVHLAKAVIELAHRVDRLMAFAIVHDSIAAASDGVTTTLQAFGCSITIAPNPVEAGEKTAVSRAVAESIGMLEGK